MPKPQFNPIRDVISGLILAATSVPQLIAYAETVGYASWRGLATAGPPLAVWGMTTGSPYLNAGVTSVTALMAQSDVNGDAYMQKHGETAYVYLVAAYSLYIGIASILLAIAGFGQLAQRVPTPVRSGFKWGCSIGVLFAAIPNGVYNRGGKDLKHLFRSSAWDDAMTPIKSIMPGAYTVSTILYSLTHPQDWSLQPTLFFVLGTIWVMQSKKFMPKFLPPGTEVILLTAFATWYSNNYNYPGGTVGEIPTLDSSDNVKIAGITLPVSLLDMRKLLTDTPLVEHAFNGSWLLLILSATLFAAINFLSIMGIAGGFEVDDGIPWSASRELLAQGTSNLAAAAVGSAPVSGSLSRSLVSRLTGTTSSLACIVTALCWMYLQPYMSCMSPTPKAALSAVIVSAVVKGVAIPQDLLKLKPGFDKTVGWTTGVFTMLSSPTMGFGFGLILYYAASLMFKPEKPKKKKE